MPIHQHPVRYHVTLPQPHTHYLHVCARLAQPQADGEEFWLPVWLPGSYLVREFARHIVSVRAFCDDSEIAVEKISKNRWRTAALPNGAQELQIQYTLYARDPSVRSAWLDEERAFFNGSSLFFAFCGHEQRPCQVQLQLPPGKAFRNWQIATTLPVDESADCADGSTCLHAENYHTLIDHPITIAALTRLHYEANGIAHELVISGQHDCDGERLCADLAAICAWQQNLFATPAPFTRYLFLVHASENDYGGLEHRDSSALITPRNDLPWPTMQGTPDSYIRFLGLCSHEYFHAWNIKRLRPAAFTPYDLNTENYTRLLWFFEGFTSYYDDLALVRCERITPDQYLAQISKTLSTVLGGSGRLRQSVAEASFDAWIKLYRPHENAINAQVNYYTKGALIGLALDLRLRAASNGAVSLDCLMRSLWQQYGVNENGVSEQVLFDAVRTTGDKVAAGFGKKISHWLQQQVSGHSDTDFDRWLKPFGLKLERATATQPAIGAQYRNAAGGICVERVHDGLPAQASGLAANDLLIAADGLRIADVDGFEQLLARKGTGAVLTLHFFRDGRLQTTNLSIGAPHPHTFHIRRRPRLSAGERALQQAWLGSCATTAAP